MLTVAKSFQKLPKHNLVTYVRATYVRTYGQTGGLLELLSQLKTIEIKATKIDLALRTMGCFFSCNKQLKSCHLISFN